MKRIGAIMAITLALAVSGCTVVDLDASGNPIMPKDPNAKPSYSNQTPQQIAEASWQGRVLDTAQQHAMSWADMQTKSQTVKAGGSESVFVRASGTVEAVDETNSRERTLTLTLNGKPVKVNLGPVIRSNALRDAAGFRFEEFTNQVQYAQLTRALNRHAVQQLPKVDASWVGKPAQTLLAVEMGHGVINDVMAVELKQGEAP